MGTIAVLAAATATAIPHGGISLAILAAQLCAFAMVAGPVIAGAALVLIVKRGVGQMRRS
ncbi:MAG: hypothetical protein M3401_18350 [Actinomycetota bacterium]|nr:hypothetical protein [Actinomycetota bacterium]